MSVFRKSGKADKMLAVMNEEVIEEATIPAKGKMTSKFEKLGGAGGVIVLQPSAREPCR
jgi:hypothetical protein